MTLLNWDAHADVREPVDGRGHSGSPFRQALLHPSGLARRYLVAGLLPQSVAAAHVGFVRNRKGQALFRAGSDRRPRSTRLYAGLRGPALASFDIDAVDQAFAPGVSAPAAGGLDPSLWLEAAYQAGRARRSPRGCRGDEPGLRPRPPDRPAGGPDGLVGPAGPGDPAAPHPTPPPGLSVQAPGASVRE